MATSKIEFSKNELLDALSDYYGKLKNKPIKVKEEYMISCYGLYETPMAKMNMTNNK